jgi:hypothetical protein
MESEADAEGQDARTTACQILVINAMLQDYSAFGTLIPGLGGYAPLLPGSLGVTDGVFGFEKVLRWPFLLTLVRTSFGRQSPKHSKLLSKAIDAESISSIHSLSRLRRG